MVIPISMLIPGLFGVLPAEAFEGALQAVAFLEVVWISIFCVKVITLRLRVSAKRMLAGLIRFEQLIANWSLSDLLISESEILTDLSGYPFLWPLRRSSRNPVQNLIVVVLLGESCIEVQKLKEENALKPSVFKDKAVKTFQILNSYKKSKVTSRLRCQIVCWFSHREIKSVSQFNFSLNFRNSQFVSEAVSFPSKVRKVEKKYENPVTEIETKSSAFKAPSQRALLSVWQSTA